jgi:hypothetical protein
MQGRTSGVTHMSEVKTMDTIPVEYRGCELSVIVAHREGGFSAMLLVEKPGGARRAVGPFRAFASAQAAERFAIEYGKAELDQFQMQQEVLETAK